MSEANKVDLPPGVQTALLQESAQAHQFLMTESRGNIQSNNQLARQSAVKKFDEIGAAESRATTGVMATPIGAPTVGNAG